MGEFRWSGGHRGSLRSPQASPLFYASFTVSFWFDLVTVLALEWFFVYEKIRSTYEAKSKSTGCQLKYLVIPLFEPVYPGCQPVFLFDNATNHSAYTDDALQAEQMNLNPNGAQPTRCDGFNPCTGRSQKMQDSKGIPTGMGQVLLERGLWPPGGLIAECKISNPNPGGKSKKVDNPESSNPLTPRSCCAQAVITSQPDFNAQKSQLEEEITEAGHLVLFYPKFHCELNWIVYYWGSSKQYARKHCTYTLAGLKEILQHALESVPDTLVFKYWQ
jgi:hypothetical protein